MKENRYYGIGGAEYLMIRKLILEDIWEAWNIEGKCPKYHREQKELLRKNWRTLYDAIIKSLI